MTIDPKQIAKMITEDPDEVNPLDNIEDEFASNEYDICSGCIREFWNEEMFYCDGCGSGWCDECADTTGQGWQESEQSISQFDPELFGWAAPHDELQTDPQGNVYIPPLTLMVKCPSCARDATGRLRARH